MRSIAGALPDRVLRRRISDLGKLERRCFATRKRFEFYRYLAAVYEFYAELKRTEATQHSARRVAVLFNVGTPSYIHLIRLIIDASLKPTPRHIAAGQELCGLPGANADAGAI